MIIIHGEDSLSSYRRLGEIIETSKSRNLAVIVKEGSDLDLASLRQDTSSTDLFGVSNCLVIKNILGGSKSKQKESLIDYLKKAVDMEIVLYESKKLTDSVLKQFSKATVESFSINSVIFKFLDVLRPGNTRVILQAWNRLLELNHEPEYVFFMLTRQVRLLIQAKSGPSYLKMAPYPKKLITTQASYFTLNQLLGLHHRLYELDKRIKTGISPLPLHQLLLQFFYLL